MIDICINSYERPKVVDNYFDGTRKTGKAVCKRYSEILRNILSCVNIECSSIEGVSIFITTHSQFGREQNVLLFYSVFIIEFTYCMYIIVNKATFIVAETIMVIIKNSIKLINTTSLFDSKAIECSGNIYLLQFF